VSPELTRSSAVMGSPLYMSPEQMRSSRNVDVRTDVWALGAILYELLTGVPPFSGETVGEVFAAVMTTEPRPVRHLRSEVPEQLEYVVKLALEKDLALRFANVGAFVIALREFATGESIALIERVQATLGRAGVMRSVAPPSVPQAQSVAPAGLTDPSWATPARVQRSSTAILLGMAALAGFIAVGALLHRLMSKPPASEPSAAALGAMTAAPGAANHATETALAPNPSVVPVASTESSSVGSASPRPSASARAPQRSKLEAPLAPSNPANAPAATEPKRKNPMSNDFK
jgi:eukaryotic-like serine/threonine-protein kinase